MTRHDGIAAQPWTGPTRRYDIVKEGVIAIIVVGLLAVGLSVAFSSPDDHVLTFQGWANAAPTNFYATTVKELAGTSESAGYGPPYNDASSGLNTGPIYMQKWMGVRIPVNPAQDFVITPLSSAQQPSIVVAALRVWKMATPQQQTTWATNFDNALSATASDSAPDGDVSKVPAGAYGPVPTLASGLLAMARSGGYDGVFMAQSPVTGAPGFYQLNYTKQILFMGDSSYLDDAATAANLQGNTWGMMNETGSYPGQAWLWLYSFWYQINPFANESQHPFGDNADAWIFWIMMILSLGLILIPFIPGIRSIPKWIPIHKLVWRDYYRRQSAAPRR